MSRKRYSSYYSEEHVNSEVEEPKTPEEYKAEEMTDLLVEEAPEEVLEEKEDVNKTVTGTVANCEKVNLRSNPDASSNVVAVLDKGTVVNVNSNASTSDFYSVISPNDQHGFIMKQFVAL